MELEGIEQQIYLQPEMAIVGAVYSVNGYTGHVVLTTSDLENTSGYQTSTDVANLIAAHNSDEEAHPYIQNLISAKQDPIVAGNGISITGGNTIAIDTTVVATQQNLATEVTNRENADIALQGQIDAISASSDVVDIVGTYQELQNYDTQHLKDNDIIKVLQDSTQGNATTYYRWSTHTSTFTLIGQEGPYYTKAAADTQFVPQTRTINSKPLSANIALTASDVSALGQNDIVQTTGTSTSQVMSQNAVTTALATKLDSADVPAGFFDGLATTSPTPATSVELNNVLRLSELQLLGDTTQDTTTGNNLFDRENAVENMILEWANANDVTEDGSLLAHEYMLVSEGDTFASNYGMCVFFFDSNDEYLGCLLSGGTTIGKQTGTYVRTFTVPSGYGIAKMKIEYRHNQGGNPSDMTSVTDIMLNVGSLALPYEPYTGGIPSPNPDYPQAVEVVTGEQTISVSDGTNSTDYTVDLGATELCKIGNYQDYIYKNGADWYVHKATSKVVFDGTENWTLASNYTNNSRFVCQDVIAKYPSPSPLYSNYFIEGVGGSDTQNICVNGTSGKIMVTISNSFATTVTAFKNWLGSNNTTIYYVLGTPTDTQITDSSLVAQLEALLAAPLYQPTATILSNGSLPAILGITAYSTNWNGMLATINELYGTLGDIGSALNIINNGGS